MSGEIEDALGVYVGPATQDEIVEAIAGHDMPGAETVALLHAVDGTLVWFKRGVPELHVSGWRKVGGEEDEDEDEANREVVLVLTNPTEQTAGNPLLMVDVPLVLAFAEDWASRLRAERFTGGVRLHFGFGPYDGHMLTLVFQRLIMHFTQDGDLAPGFGSVNIQVRDIELSDDQEVGDG
jgi:hypothetical protein